MAGPPEEAGQVDLSVPTIALGVQVHLLVLDCAPQPFDQDVVLAAFLPDQLILIFLCQCHLQGIETELRVAVGFSEGLDISGEQIHDRHQVEESLLQRDGGDIGGPDLIHSRDRADIHKAGKPLGWISWDCGSGLLVNRMSNLGGA